MAKFRKKPVIIEAAQIEVLHQCANNNRAALPEWVLRAIEAGSIVFFNSPKKVEIKTLEGTLTGNLEDWLIQGVQGELYACKPDIFEATYEAA